jgi:hypothetical protein
MAETARHEDWPRTIEEFEVWHARQPDVAALHAATDLAA